MNINNYLDNQEVIQEQFYRVLKLIQNIMELYDPSNIEYKHAIDLMKRINQSQDIDQESVELLSKMYEERVAAMSLLRNARAQYFITITPVSNMERSLLHDFTNKLIRRANRCLFGRNYFKNCNGFLEGLVIFENASSSCSTKKYSAKRNTLPHNHYHCFIKTDKNYKEMSAAFLQGTKSIKFKRSHVFNFDLGINIQYNDNRDKVLFYSTKERKNADNIFPLTIDGISDEDQYCDKYLGI